MDASLHSKENLNEGKERPAVIPDGLTFDAIIFDCDGTLGDSMPMHYVAWVETLTPYGAFMSEDEFYAMGGWPTKIVAQTMLDRFDIKTDLAAMVKHKEKLFVQKLSEVPPVPQVVEVVHYYHGKIPLAVATGGLPEVCLGVLKSIGLSPKLFNTIVTCEDVQSHKPEPEIFLEAARRLNVPPDRCIVFEDVDPGIEAARRAGMTSVDVRTFYTPRRIT
ncbi:Fructose-1-phosphate phosphatase YqaB [Planctopirus ephydatiae]|uniref:Fructose-1-phosphate phosphatase YqaB n=1 Tax=Planctopirus ephydatiae TaxID=2528019 RepID=A0A518GPT5_9PLAN|nr:HAD-IA family hydrolase [Planctopirus ephydatiae]QDV30632.1 Fructose-1-phosphate phosphatase YqaB [Planctopirus ephydatiae]